jgi:catalase
VLSNSGIDTAAPGIVIGERPNRGFARDVITSLTVHRHWDRAEVHPTRTLTEEVV